MDPSTLQIDDVTAAAERVGGVVHRTPVLTSRTLDGASGCRVFLKCENFQRAGAFKIRGAYNALSRFTPEQRAGGAIAYSSGNHAQAVALSGNLLAISTLVVMPTDAPRVKVEATRAYGAEIAFYDPASEEREAVTERLRAERGMTLVPPFDHPHIIAGQGTAALELVEEVPDLDLVLAPCGGGGLLSGTAIAVKARRPAARVMGVEPEGADNGNRAFRSGRIERVESPDTFADGLRPKALGEHTLREIRARVDDMLTVSEAEIRETLRFLWGRMKMIVEPSGAVGLAPVYHGRFAGRNLRVGVILSGGNADIGAVAQWMNE